MFKNISERFCAKPYYACSVPTSYTIVAYGSLVRHSHYCARLKVCLSAEMARRDTDTPRKPNMIIRHLQIRIRYTTILCVMDIFRCKEKMYMYRTYFDIRSVLHLRIDDLTCASSLIRGHLHISPSPKPVFATRSATTTGRIRLYFQPQLTLHYQTS